MLEALQVAEDPARYHEFLFRRLEAARELDRQLFQNQLVLPDFEALAKERYKISKNEIAPVPEIREASHILLLCTEDCEGETEAETVARIQSFKDRILEGESFSDLASNFLKIRVARPGAAGSATASRAMRKTLTQSFRDALFALIRRVILVILSGVDLVFIF